MANGSQFWTFDKHIETQSIQAVIRRLDAFTSLEQLFMSIMERMECDPTGPWYSNCAIRLFGHDLEVVMPSLTGKPYKCALSKNGDVSVIRMSE